MKVDTLIDALGLSLAGAWEVDMNDGLGTWSEPMYRICGLEPPEGEGSSKREDLLRIVAPQDRHKMMQAFEKAVREEKVFELAHRVIWPDGSNRACFSRGKAVGGKDGQPLRMIGITQDMSEQARIEESLRDAEARFLAFMDHSPFSAWMRTEAGQLVYCNERFAAHMGLQPHELMVSGDKTSWLSREYVENSVKDDQRVLELDRSSENIEHVPMQDGSIHHWLVLKFPIRSQAGDTFVGGVSLDLTARYDADEKLRASERRLRSVMQSASEGIAATDQDGKIIAWNQAAERMFGYEESEVLGSPLLMLLGDEGKHAYTQSPLPEDLRNLVVPGRRKDGKEFQLELGRSCWSAGTATHATILMRDVTERLRMEEQLRISEEQMRITLDAALDAVPQIVWTARPDGTLSFLSRKWFEYAGVSFPLMSEKGWMDWVHPEDLDKSMTLWQKALAEGETFELEYRLRRGGDGSYRWHIGRALPVRDASGRILQWFGTSTDIHDHKTAQEEQAQLRASEAAALETSRLKSEFLAHMSHEIRTPINGVLGMADLLMDTRLTQEQLSFADAIHRSAEALLGIINDILDFSKIEAGKLEIEKIDFELVQALEDVEKTQAFQARAKKLTMEFGVDSEIPADLRGDPGRLRQILGNLVSNAIKFTEKGSVRIRASLAMPLDIEKQTALLRFEVADTGVGIAPTGLSRMFQPFSQADSSTSRRFGGTGLGLSICKSLVEQMGGEIGVESREGFGSTFWFTVPYEIAAQSQLGAAPGADAKPAPSQDSRVLIAEDNSINQTILLKVLEKLGVAADAVANGQEALDALEHGTYDLVLMDCQMPGMDGYEATTRIRAAEGKSYRWIPIVAVTANAIKGDREKCLTLGMNDYVSKPVHPGELGRVLERWLRPSEAAAAPVAQAAGLRVERTSVDQQMISELRALDEGKGEVLKQLVDLFTNGCRVKVQAVVQAHGAGDVKRLRAEAHSLKSSAANLGATRMAEICQQLESANTPELLVSSTASAASLLAEYEKVCEELKSILNAA